MIAFRIMARRPKPGKCVHCLSDPVERNWDHVFPESWYPDETPSNLEKWQIPSCLPCNSEYGRIEDDFRSRVALCLDPHHPASRSLVRKALRSVNPNMGRDEVDRMRRGARGRKILTSALSVTELPMESVVPGLGPKGHPLEDQHPILVPAEYFERLTTKIVRGIYFIQDKKFIEPPYTIDFFLLPEEGARPVREILDRAGKTFSREPCLTVRRAVAEDDPMHSIFEIELWQQFKTYASVQRGKD